MVQHRIYLDDKIVKDLSTRAKYIFSKLPAKEKKYYNHYAKYHLTESTGLLYFTYLFLLDPCAYG